MFTASLAIRLRVSLPSEFSGVALRLLRPFDLKPDRIPDYSDLDRVVGFATAGG